MILNQKQSQLKTIMEMNRGNIPRDLFEKFQNDAYFAENPIIIKKY